VGGSSRGNKGGMEVARETRRQGFKKGGHSRDLAVEQNREARVY